MEQGGTGFKSGERVTVAAQDGSQVWVKNDAGTLKLLPLQHSERFEVYRTNSILVADGERLRISRNGYAKTPDGKQHRINNGDMITVQVTPKGLVDQRGWMIPLSYGHLASGVVTSHSTRVLKMTCRSWRRAPRRAGLPMPVSFTSA